MRILRTKLRLVASIAIAGLAASGCATMNKNECLTVDWKTVGYEDGAAGHSGDRIAQHRKACAKHGVSPDLSLYQAGREEGLREYCQPANGFRLGARGQNYGGICPDDLDDAFVGAYESGRQLHTLQARAWNAASQLEAKYNELERVEDSIVQTSAVIVRDESTKEERAQALIDAKQLAERSGRLKAEIRQLQEDKAIYERDLEEYRSGLGYGY